MNYTRVDMDTLFDILRVFGLRGECTLSPQERLKKRVFGKNGAMTNVTTINKKIYIRGKLYPLGEYKDITIFENENGGITVRHRTNNNSIGID
jgi:hypothetical protein